MNYYISLLGSRLMFWMSKIVDRSSIYIQESEIKEALLMNRSSLICGYLGTNAINDTTPLSLTLSPTAHGQLEKSEMKPSEKASKAEVSSPVCHLTNTPKLACLSEARDSQTLRRRRCADKAPAGAAMTPPTLSAEDFAPAVKPPIMEKVQRFKYARVSATYPRIKSDNEIRADEDSKLTKTITPPSRLPSSQTSGFLKHSVKNRNTFEDDPVDDYDEDDIEEGRPNHRESLCKNQLTTDLDIQFQQMKFANSSSSTSSVKPDDAHKSSGKQSLVQYCNFEEKKVVRVAPHIRRKDVICETVDAWSRRGDFYPPKRSSYRPLIFGGTYPIDAPLANNDTASERDRKVTSGRCISKTFDIDAPMSLE